MVINRYFNAFLRMLLLASMLWQAACDGDIRPSTSHYGGKLGRSFLSCARMAKSECEASSDCKYLLSNNKIGTCFSTSELGKSCSQITGSSLCETPGYAKEDCRYFGYSCRASASLVFDAHGFDTVTRRHRNGSLWDDNNFDIDGLYYGMAARDRDFGGFDVNGRNQRGFDRNNRLANGDLRDARGFDAYGNNISGRLEAMVSGQWAQLDARGFDINGVHMNGSLRDAHGFDANGLVVGSNRYDVDGFDVNGINRDTGTHFDVRNLDREGMGPDGRNAEGFDRDGKTIFGHTFKVGIRNWGGMPNCHQVKNKDGLVSLAGPGCFSLDEQQAWVFSDLGLDPEGYYPSLTLAAVGVDESFNAQGYNREGKNFLGITKARFDQVGYEAIVLDNMGLVNNMTWNELITNFENDCFTIGKFKHKTNGTVVAQKPAGNWMLTHDRFDPAADEILDLSTKSRFRQHLKDYWLLGDLLYNEQQLENNLKKGIYFCRWLYGSGMEKAKKFDELSPVTGRIKHRLTPVDYEKELEKGRIGDNSDYLTTLKALLNHEDLLIDATYERVSEGYEHRRDILGNIIPFPEYDRTQWHLWSKRLPDHRRIDLQDFFTKVRNAQLAGNNSHNYVADIKKVSYQLYKLSQKLATTPKEERAVALTKFLHGGLHCPDAKRQAADDAYKYYCEDDFNRLANLGFGDDVATIGVVEEIHRSLNVAKATRFTAWLREKIDLGGGDLSSGFSNAYKQFAPDLGLPPMENRFALNHNIQWEDIENDFLLNNNSAESRNNYSPKRMSQVIVDGLNQYTVNVSKLLWVVFGYLDRNVGGDQSAGIIESYTLSGQKYLISDLLRRLGFLKLR